MSAQKIDPVGISCGRPVDDEPQPVDELHRCDYYI
jgi:hypothetical protein